MNAIELKDSDSNDSDVFVIEHIKPAAKLTYQLGFRIKYGVLDCWDSEQNKTKKKRDRVRKRSTDSPANNAKKKKLHSTFIEGSAQNLSNPACVKNKTQISFKNKEYTSDWIKKCSTKSVEKIIESSTKGEKLGHEVLKNALEPETSVSSKSISHLANGFGKKNIEKLELSPGISRNRKKFNIDNITPKRISPKKKVKKPLITLFDMVNDDTNEVIKESEVCKTNSTEKEPNRVLTLNVAKSNNIEEKSIMIDECFDDNHSEPIINELSLDFFSCDEFQHKFANIMSTVEEDVKKLNNNSELLCFLLKKIICDESKKQIDLEKESLKTGKVIEKLFSESEYRILQKFLYLENNACKVLVRMLGRKKDWHRVSAIKYKDISDNLETEFEILSKENFVDTNVEEENLRTQMNLLSKPEILKLCKAFNVSLKSNNTNKKEVLINSLIEDGRKQISVLEMFQRKNCTSRLNLIKSEVKNILGLCVRIKKNIFQVFHKILVLFSFAHYHDEESKRFSNELFLFYQVYKNMIKFPNYKLSPTVVFETRKDFEDYEKSLLLQDSFEIAISNKNYNDFISAFNKAKDEFKKLLANQEYKNRYLNLKPFLQKFSAGTVYARILTSFCKKFKKKTDKLEVLSTVQFLLDQNLFLLGKKGEWYEILSKTLEHQKQYNNAAEVLIKSINDPLINEVQKLCLQLRGHNILKKKTCGINVALRKLLVDVCVTSIQEPANIEIKGKVLDGNESGFKSVYIQDYEHGKMFTSVEERAIIYYKLNGFTKGYHVEGFIIQTIYFLLFYDIIYESSPEGVFQTPFQEAPLDLYSSFFYLNRKQDIDLLLSEMPSWNDGQIERKIRDTYYRNYNTNCIIKWNDEFTPELFCEVIKCITIPILVLIFQRFIKSFRVVRSGFPDLTLWNPETNRCKFVEVKSPNDKLSPAQRIWLDYLKNIGLECEVCNIRNTSNKCIG